MDEIIIVAPRKDVFEDEKLAFQGVETDPFKVSDIVINIESNYTTMRRGDAEENPAFKQPIPYCIIQRRFGSEKEVFLYKRLSGGGETRLHDKLSIGAGGHMNDNPDIKGFSDILKDNLDRELEEELDIKSELRQLNFLGIINDDENEVGKVHVGLLVILLVDEDATVDVRETDQLEGEWIKVDKLLEEETFSKLESWSQIAAKALA